MAVGRTLQLFGAAAVFFAVGCFCPPNVASAEDVWCCSRGGRSYYLDSDSINAKNLPKEMTYRAIVKTVLDDDGSLADTAIYGFESQNDCMVGMVFNKSAEQWDTPRTNEKPVMRAVWETMKPCLREKRISYSDSWVWE